MGRRNPIHVIGDPIRKGVTWLSDELIRSGAHADALGSDGFVIIAYLLSRVGSTGQPAWETSAAQMSAQFGWGRNRERATRAINNAIKDNRLLVRTYVRDGQLVPRRCAYVVCAGGRQFTERELFDWSVPIQLSSKSVEQEGSL